MLTARGVYLCDGACTGELYLYILTTYIANIDVIVIKKRTRI